VLRAAGWDVALVDAFALSGPGSRGATTGGAPRRERGANARRGRGRARRGLVVVAYGAFHRPPSRDDVLGPCSPAASASRRDADRARGLLPVRAALRRSRGCGRALELPGGGRLGKYERRSRCPRSSRRGSRTDGDLVAPCAGSRRSRSTRCRYRPGTCSISTSTIDSARVSSRGSGRGRWAFPSTGARYRRHLARLPVLVRALLVEPRASRGRAEDAAPLLGELPGALRRLARDALRSDAARAPRRARERERATLRCAARAAPRPRRAVRRAERHARGLLEPRHFAAMRGHVTTVSVSAESGVQRVVTEVVNKQLRLRGDRGRRAERARAGCADDPLHHRTARRDRRRDQRHARVRDGSLGRFGAWPAVQFATPLPGTELARGRTLPVVSDWGPCFQTARHSQARSSTPRRCGASSGRSSNG